MAGLQCAQSIDLRDKLDSRGGSPKIVRLSKPSNIVVIVTGFLHIFSSRQYNVRRTRYLKWSRDRLLLDQGPIDRAALVAYPLPTSPHFKTSLFLNTLPTYTIPIVSRYMSRPYKTMDHIRSFT